MRRPGPFLGSAALAVFSLLAPAAPLAQPRGMSEPPADRFGGIGIRVAEPSESFRVRKVGQRWLFVTPEGNAFWMLGVFAVDETGSVDDLKDSYANRIIRKYGTKYKWAEQTAKRLKLWGFNTLAEYASLYMWPVAIEGGRANAEKMPFVAIVRPSFYGLTNKWNYAPGPFKDLIAGSDPVVYTGWKGNGVPDVFDPNFERYADAWIKKIDRQVLTSPWLIGIAIDDADNVVGFGPGPEVLTPRIHPHIAWLVLATNFQQSANKRLEVTYADPKVYSKYALRDFLRNKYATVAGLNAAWGASYTSWDSDGGWPSGKGFLDESGRSPWAGNDFDRLTKATPRVRADLDEFLYQYARRYFSALAAPLRKQAPQTLVFGPATLNGWGGLTRRQILKAAGESLDVIQAGMSSQHVLELTLKYTGDVPIVTWEGTVANRDSALWRYPDAEGTLKNQQERGRNYTDKTALLFGATTASGVKPVVGLKFWAWNDSWGEKMNWGLVSFLDNAYDGQEAVRAKRLDPFGFSTGGEERDYGDFTTSVRNANAILIRQLTEELTHNRGQR